MAYIFLVSLFVISIVQISFCTINSEDARGDRGGNRFPQLQSEDAPFNANAGEQNPNSDLDFDLGSLLSVLSPSQMQQLRNLLPADGSPLDGTNNPVDKMERDNDDQKGVGNVGNGGRRRNRNGGRRRQRRRRRRNARGCRRRPEGNGVGFGSGMGYGSGGGMGDRQGQGYGSGIGYGSGGNGFGAGSGTGIGGNGFGAGSGIGMGGGGGRGGGGGGRGRGRGDGYGSGADFDNGYLGGNNDTSEGEGGEGGYFGGGGAGGRGGGGGGNYGSGGAGRGYGSGRDPYDFPFPTISGTQGAMLGGGSEISGVKVNSFARPGNNNNGIPSRMASGGRQRNALPGQRGDSGILQY